MNLLGEPKKEQHFFMRIQKQSLCTYLLIKIIPTISNTIDAAEDAKSMLIKVGKFHFDLTLTGRDVKCQGELMGGEYHLRFEKLEDSQSCELKTTPTVY